MSRQDHLGDWQPSRAMLQVVDDAAAAMGVTRADLLGRRKPPPMARARQAACWALRQRWPALSYPMVGRIMGDRDHSTIVYAVARAKLLRERDAAFARLTDALAAGEAPPACRVKIDPAVLARMEAKAALAREEAGLREDERSPLDVRMRLASQAGANARFVAVLRREHPERFAQPETA